MSFDEHLEIKKEAEEINDEIEMDGASDNSADMPMNLTNTTDSNAVQSTNANCDTAARDADKTESFLEPEPEMAFSDNEMLNSVKNKLKNKLTTNAITLSQMVPANDDPIENQNIFCKKVRQAQQSKGMMMAMQSMPFQETLVPPPHVPQLPAANGNAEAATQMLMPSKIPSKRKFRKDPNMSLKKSKYQSKLEAGEHSSALNQVESNDLVTKDEFILPRERFISICNMVCIRHWDF